MTTRKVCLQRGSLGELEVEVGTNVDTVESVTTGITTIVIPLAEEVTLVLIVDGCIILHCLGTTCDVHIGIVRHGVVLKEFLLPIYIRITLAHQESGLRINTACRSIIFVDEFGRADVTPA